MSQTRKNPSPQRKSPVFIAAVTVAASLITIAVIAALFLFKNGGTATAGAKAEDLVIPISAVSAAATFYPVEIDGTKLEVIAVETPDGAIRTAFNTCQVCYDSGRGYYKQEGDQLVCQNCGNRFQMDQVERQSGGCNPVPIFPDNKIVTDESITIPGAFLAEAKIIFANWKTTR